MKISAIIVTYNSGDDIIHCLDSLLASDPLPEIIVVDNASTDGTPQRIEQEYPSIKLITNDDNRGFGAANNQGVAIANGDIIALINPDLIVEPNALAILSNYLTQHPKVGIVGPKTVNSNEEIAITSRPEYNVWRILTRWLAIDRFIPQLTYGNYPDQMRSATQPFECDWLQGSCLVMRRQDYLSINGFDEGFFLFMEDTDICARVKDLGQKIIYHPDATVMHKESTTVSRYPLVRIRGYHISPLYYFRKRNQHANVLLLKFGFTIELLGKIIIRRLRPNEINLAKARAEWTVLGEVWRY